VKIRFFIVVVLLAALVASPTGAQQARRRVFPPNSEPYGRTYKQWAGRWADWFWEIPGQRHPGFELTPRSCRRHQRGKVWFVVLAPPGGRCVIPAKKPVLVQGPGWECSTAEGHGRTYAQLRRCANRRFKRDWGRDVFTFRVKLDGRRIRRARRWVYTSPGEIIDFPRENPWNIKPGPTKSVSRAFLFMLRPLRPGQHTLRVWSRGGLVGGTTIFETTIESVSP
jgi:hypothetical protein